MPRTIDELVNHQILRWQEERNIASRPGHLYGEHEQRPMICLTRTLGARGRDVATAAAERLGFQVYGQNLVDEIARETHVRRQLVESLDERVQSALDRLITAQLGGGVALAENEYVFNLSKVVHTLGRHGRGIIIGRGAQHILDPARTLRVRVVAPLEVRAARVAQREAMSVEAARAKAVRTDAERAAFYRRHFDADVGDPESYDLILNTGTTEVEVCGEVIATAFRARFE